MIEGANVLVFLGQQSNTMADRWTNGLFHETRFPAAGGAGIWRRPYSGLLSIATKAIIWVTAGRSGNLDLMECKCASWELHNFLGTGDVYYRDTTILHTFFWACLPLNPFTIHVGSFPADVCFKRPFYHSRPVQVSLIIRCLLPRLIGGTTSARRSTGCLLTGDKARTEVWPIA